MSGTIRACSHKSCTSQLEVPLSHCEGCLLPHCFAPQLLNLHQKVTVDVHTHAYARLPIDTCLSDTRVVQAGGPTRLCPAAIKPAKHEFPSGPRMTSCQSNPQRNLLQADWSRQTACCFVVQPVGDGVGRRMGVACLQSSANTLSAVPREPNIVGQIQSSEEDCDFLLQ